MKRVPCLVSVFAVACSAPPAPADGERKFLHQQILSVSAPDTNGVVWVGFSESARNYVIDPKLSPEPAALVAFAKQAVGTDRRVHATCLQRDSRQKTPETFREPGLPDVLLRLDDAPDPRQRR